MRFGVLCLALAFWGCDDDGGGGGPSQEVTVLFGTVTAADGSELGGVRVTAGGESTVTSSDGTYQLEAPAISEVTVTFSRDGYLKAMRTTPVLDKMPTALHTQLMAEAAAVELDAEMGGEVAGARGAKVAIPAGAFVSPEGASVAGMVDVHLTPIDPSNPDEVNGTAGRFQGEMGGSTVLLESFGMVEITVRQDGEELQVAGGMALNLAIPAPEGMDSPPERAPLWSLNEDTNEWVHEGEAVLNADTGLYEAEIGHMSSWNVDNPTEATCITGLVEDPDGDPLPGARIIASGVDYFGTSSATSIEDGRFYVAVRMDSTVTVTAAHQQGGGAQRTVMSGSTPTGVPPNPDRDECLDVGVWVVERGIVRIEEEGGGTREIDCRNVGANPFAGTCASGMFDIFTCFAPAGTCDIRGDGLGGGGEFEIVYSNGAKVTVNIDQGNPDDPSDQTFTATYYGPAGQVCATGEQDTSQEGDQTFWLTINGQRYGILDRGDDDDVNFAVQCPNGTVETFLQSELDAVSACGVGGDSSDGSQQCTLNGQAQPMPGPGPNDPPMEGGQGSICGDGRAACDAPLQCCMIVPDQPVGVCYPADICQLAMNQSR